MLQITTSKKESVSRTSANLVLADTYIANHLELTLVKTQSNGKTLRKIVFVFKDYEYTVCFFDEETGARKTITGEIESSVRFKKYLDAAKEKEISILFRILAELEDK